MAGLVPPLTYRSEACCSTSALKIGSKSMA
jgi:hypothetical protein